jgi:hypothetical protein
MIVTGARAIDGVREPLPAGAVHLPGTVCGLKDAAILHERHGTTEPVVKIRNEGTAGLGVGLEERLLKGEWHG